MDVTIYSFMVLMDATGHSFTEWYRRYLEYSLDFHSLSASVIEIYCPMLQYVKKKYSRTSMARTPLGPRKLV